PLTVTSGGGLLLAGGSSPPRVTLANGSSLSSWRTGGLAVSPLFSGAVGFDPPLSATADVSTGVPLAFSGDVCCLLQPTNIKPPINAAAPQCCPAFPPRFAQTAIVPSPSQLRSPTPPPPRGARS